jgi:polyhydroxyalkanoate synthesis regulator phasin
VAESWQSYANLVGGVTRNLGGRASARTWALLGQVRLEDAVVDTGERIAKLVEEISNASRANRELLENLIVGEVDKAASRLGFVRTEELQELRAEVAELRAEVQAAARPRSTTRPAPARKAAMKKAAESAAAAG